MLIESEAQKPSRAMVLGKEGQLGTEPSFLNYLPKYSPYTTCTKMLWEACLKCRFLGPAPGRGKLSLGGRAQG